MTGPGRVFLVGAGPGDPELLTLKALRVMARADAVVYDRLISPSVLSLLPDLTDRYPVGKAPQNHPVPQDKINALLVMLARQGHLVVRLKGGDPFIFGRGGEEAKALRDAGIPVEIVPGISAAQGTAATVGLPLTQRGVASGLRFITGHCRADLPLNHDWAGLADPETTLVVYMGASGIAEIAQRLITHGLPGDTPVLAVSQATLPEERRLEARLDKIATEVAIAAMPGPVLFIIGRVVALHNARTGIVTRMVTNLPCEPAHA